MTVEVVKAEISNFLQGSDAEIICIKGNWGVGKTHIWNSLFTSARESQLIKARRYSFISLYGLKSIEDVKSALIESADSVTTRAPKWHERAGRWILSKIGKVDDRRAKAISSAIQVTSFGALEEWLICIDDFERRAPQLKVSEVLGLANFLNEHRKCKVAIILNEDKLDDEAKGEFKKLFEKSIDAQLEIDPSPEHCAAVAISESDLMSEEIKKIV